MDWLRQALSQATAAFRAMTAAQRASMIMLGLTVVVALGMVVILGARPKYVVVASGLDQAEMREAASLLDGRGEPYKPDLQKGAILVAQDRQPAVAAMLRKSDVVSREKVFDRESYRAFASDNLFMSERERAKLRRDALAGELRNMIKGLDGVESCRVAITDESEGEFNLAPEKVGVGVTITPRGGKKIDQAFANSVIDLVSSGVNNCDPAKITVIDTHNPVRQFHKEDTDTEVNIGNKRFALNREVEQQYQKKINELIASMGYLGNAVVTCKKIDLEKVKKLIQTVKPDEVVTVSSKVHKLDAKDGVAPGGPTGYQAVEPGGTAGTLGPASPGTPSTRKENDAETRTICSFVTEEILSSPVKIANLTASVVINDRVVQKKDEKAGVVQAYEAPSDEEMKKWKNLIAKIMGIEETDDETVNKSIFICHMKPPNDQPGILPPAPPPSLGDLAASYAPYARLGGVLMLTAVAFFFLYGLGKRAAVAPPAEAAAPAAGPGAISAAEAAGAEPDELKLRQMQDRLRNLIGQDPRKVAALVKRWLAHEG